MPPPDRPTARRRAARGRASSRPACPRERTSWWCARSERRMAFTPCVSSASRPCVSRPAPCQPRPATPPVPRSSIATHRHASRALRGIGATTSRNVPVSVSMSTPVGGGLPTATPCCSWRPAASISTARESVAWRRSRGPSSNATMMRGRHARMRPGSPSLPRHPSSRAGQNPRGASSRSPSILRGFRAPQDAERIRSPRRSSDRAGELIATAAASRGWIRD
jgi:hypothetical protein